MGTDHRLTSYRGTAWCHAPADQPFELEKLAGADGWNRWNRDGQQTLYLALDQGVALAELARHLDPQGAAGEEARRMVRLDVAADGLLDVRDAETRRAIGGPASATSLLDREVARGLADEARALAGCQGLLVPSAAFLDDPSRGNAVLFLDQADRSVGTFVTRCTVAGELRIDGRRGD